MILDEEVYLEHYGVKGMKWGVRNAYRTQKLRKMRKYGDKTKGLTKAQKKARRERRIDRVLFGTRLAAGAVFVASLYSMKGNPSAYKGTRLRGTTPSKSVTDIINAERNTQLSSLIRTHREGHIDKEQLTNFKSILNRRYDRRIADAVRS